MKQLLLVIIVFVISLGSYASTNTMHWERMQDRKRNYISNKVYTDVSTALMWQDQPYKGKEIGAYKRNYSAGKVGTWNYAKRYCKKLNYEGYSDWRLPTVDELRSLYHKRERVFHNTKGDDFWSSIPADKNKYYVVYPIDAYPYTRNKRESNYIRCVRYWTPTKRETIYSAF